jgi:replicative DNA helicase
MSQLDASALQASRIPPHDEAAEKGALGSILLDAERVLPLFIQQGLEPEAFYVPAHSAIYSGMVELFRSGTAVDPLLLGTHLRGTNQLERSGGAIYLDRLVDSTPTAAHAEFYAAVVELAWLKRKVISASREAESVAYEHSDETADELIARAQAPFLNIHHDQRIGDKHAAWERVEQNIQGAMRGEVVGIPSPWPTFDRETGGPRRGMVTALASKKGYGKSSLCATWMHYLASREDPIPVLGMPFEDGEELTWLRMAGIESRVPSFMASMGRIDDGQYAQLSNNGRRLIERPLYLLGRRGMTIDGIKAAAIQYKLRYDIQALFVDAFKDIRREWRDSNSEDARISCGLCDIAEMLNIAVIVVHHIIKSGGKEDDDGVPRDLTVEDIRGNFRIIDDARMVNILQPQLLDEDGEEFKPNRLQCARNNHGPTTTVPLEFEKQFNHFFERPPAACQEDPDRPEWSRTMDELDA